MGEGHSVFPVIDFIVFRRWNFIGNVEKVDMNFLFMVAHLGKRNSQHNSVLMDVCRSG